MSFTCPRCHRTSHHPDDEANGYCGSCHRYTAPPARPGVFVRGGEETRDYFAEGMMYDLDGNPLTTLQWARLYEDRFKDMSPDAFWRAGLDVVDDCLEVSTVWLGNNIELFGSTPLYWETMCFWTEDRQPYYDFTMRHPDRATAIRRHRELVANLRELGPGLRERLRAITEAAELSPDAAVWHPTKEDD